MSARGVLAAVCIPLLVACGTTRSSVREAAESDQRFQVDSLQGNPIRPLKQLVETGRWNEAAELIHGLRTRLVQTAPGRWDNVWDLVHGHLRNPPTALVGAYRKLYDAEAAAEFEAAWRGGDHPACSRLVDRHFLATGFKARAERLVAAMEESGRPAAVVRLGGRLLRMRDPEKWGPTLLARIAHALFRMDRHWELKYLHAEVLDRSNPDRWVRLGDDQVLLGDLFVKLENMDAPAAQRRVSSLTVGAGERMKLPDTWLVIGINDGRCILEDGRGGSSALGVTGLLPLQITAWRHGGRLHLLVENGWMFSIELGTARINWARKVEGILDRLPGDQFRIPR